MQLGGQTPLKLTRRLEAAGVHDPRHVARRDRHRRGSPALRARSRASSGSTQPPNGTATSVEEALEAAERIGYPVLVRPSYVLGGRAMQIVYDADVARGVFRDGGARVRGAARAHRPIPRGRVRVRRRRDLRRHARRDRRHHAAHRGRRHSLRRLGVRAAAVSHRRDATCRRCASRRSRSRRRSASSG